ncbi:hypothetical protein [Jeotgalibacillus sp. JSM ZJ347]|uniref:hypothetical protein n=1 Tax=Jeotgalibacillus sp. JSM ZJ347 TaxID=3342117 RepID=UPI0035A92DAE
MSLYGSSKEHILNTILMTYPEIVSKLIKRKYEHLEQEMYKWGRYIDLHGYNKRSKLPVYIETQLNKADQLHIDQVKKIIDMVDEGIIIWVASAHSKEIIQELHTMMHFSILKPIDLYLVEYPVEYTPFLSALENESSYERWRKMIATDIPLPELKVTNKISLIPKGYKGEFIAEVQSDIMGVRASNEYLLRHLKKELPYFRNIHRSKSNLDNRQLQFGGGLSGFEYVISMENMRYLAFLKFRLVTFKHERLFLEIKEKLKIEFTDKEILVEELVVTFPVPRNLPFRQKVDVISDRLQRVLKIVEPAIKVEQEKLKIMKKIKLSS